jgi:hypothetical protein
MIPKKGKKGVQLSPDALGGEFPHQRSGSRLGRLPELIAICFIYETTSA